MAKNLDQRLAAANLIKSETIPNGNTAPRVGGAMEDMNNAWNEEIGEINVTTAFPPASGYHTAETARSVVLESYRRKGRTISYQTAAGTWVKEQFRGDSTATWLTASNWYPILMSADQDVYNVTNKVPLAAGEYYNPTTARNAVPAQIRKLGLGLKYLSGYREIDTLTITGPAITDGNIIIFLNGVQNMASPVIIAGNTAIEIATKIRTLSWTGWTTGGTPGTAVVTFTRTIYDAVSAPTFTSTAGITATFTRTITGQLPDWIHEEFTGPSTASWTTTTNWRKLATSTDIASVETDLNELAQEISEITEKVFEGPSPLHLSNLIEKEQELTIVASTANRNLLPYDLTTNTSGYVPVSDTTVTYNGLTITVNLDGSITFYGAKTSDFVLYLRNHYSSAINNRCVFLEAGNYTLSLQSTYPAIGGNVRFTCSANSSIFASPGSNKIITVPSDGVYAVYIAFVYTINVSQESPITLYPQIERGNLFTSYQIPLIKGSTQTDAPSWPIIPLTLEENGYENIVIDLDVNSGMIVNRGVNESTLISSLPVMLSTIAKVVNLNKNASNYQSFSASIGVSPCKFIGLNFLNGETIVLVESMAKKNKQLVFFSNIDFIGAIIFRHGNQVYDSGEVIINSTNIVIKTYNTSFTERYNQPHGLDLTGYVGVILSCGNTNNLTVKLITNGGIFTTTQVYWSASNGVIEVENDGSILNNVSVAWNYDDYKKALWAFGDSYFDFESASRWPKYVVSWGFDNFLANGFPGAKSADVYPDLVRALKYGTPKYILWCLGMNDPDTTSINQSWLNYVQKVITLCNEIGITPILSTIPNCPSIKHTFKNSWVKSSGYRYINFADSVGASIYPSSWYAGMLHTDNVHPTDKGAIALAMRALCDAPEIIQK